ncbi:MAG: zinc dependent phospholipase C family protein [Lachnospiraceae bacterium]|nr:zinc dependent phospholipase C family protein [Lachnospiraceae bacterium]
MPGFRSHFIFGQNALSSCKTAEHLPFIKKHLTCYQLGQQGPDLFFYFPRAHIFHHNIGSIMHNNATMVFIDSLISYRNHFIAREDREIADAYIVGFLGHYCCDVACHPYIHYRTQKMDYLNEPAKNFGIHVALETDIDTTLLRHYLHLTPSQFALDTCIRIGPRERIVLSHLISRALSQTYEEGKMWPITVNLAICNFWLINKLMRDPKGRKRRFVRYVDQLIFHCPVMSSVIANDGLKNYKDPCNLRHLPWRNPWNPEVTSHQDIYQLMEVGLNKYETLLSDYKALMNTLPKRLVPGTPYNEEYYHRLNNILTDIGDLSYDSGLPL